jgi:hypothetical protein
MLVEQSAKERGVFGEGAIRVSMLDGPFFPLSETDIKQIEGGHGFPAKKEERRIPLLLKEPPLRGTKEQHSGRRPLRGVVPALLPLDTRAGSAQGSGFP